VTYKAHYNPTIRSYSISFVDYDGTPIQVDGQDSKSYNYGTTAANISMPAAPSREDTAEWDYEFTGWSPEIADVT
jgi:hypothetical protein